MNKAQMPVEVWVLLAGVLLLSVGLAFWLGWYVAATVVGGLLVAGGVSSARMKE